MWWSYIGLTVIFYGSLLYSIPSASCSSASSSHSWERESRAAIYIICIYLKHFKHVICTEAGFRKTIGKSLKNMLLWKQSWESTNSSEGSWKLSQKTWCFSREVSFKVLQQREKRDWHFPRVLWGPKGCRGGKWSQYCT